VTRADLVAAAPVVSFTPTPSSGAAPLTVSFTDTSTPGPGVSITSWTWNFGDGSTVNSTVQNPVHAYSADGTYRVNLTVIDANAVSNTTSVIGAVTVQASIGITVTNDPVSLTLVPGTTTTNNEIQFTVTSTSNWNVTASDANETTNGYMTNYSVSGEQYGSPSTQLNQPFKVKNSAGSFVALSTNPIIKTGTAIDSGTAYPLYISQDTKWTDPVLHGTNVYRIVITLTATTSV
jgi:PKD repeat protein